MLWKSHIKSIRNPKEWLGSYIKTHFFHIQSLEPSPEMDPLEVKAFSFKVKL